MPRAIPADPKLTKVKIRRPLRVPRFVRWRAAIPSPNPLDRIKLLEDRTRQEISRRGIQLGSARSPQQTPRFTKADIEAEVKKACVDPQGGVYHLREDEYVLERLDHRHRPGRGLAIIWDYYKENNCDQYEVELDGVVLEPPVNQILHVLPDEYFFEWIDSIANVGEEWIVALLQYAYNSLWRKNNPNAMPAQNWLDTDNEWQEFLNTAQIWKGWGRNGLKYLEGIERRRFRVWKTTDGRLGWNFDPFSGDGELLDTTQELTAFGNQGYIWTLNTDREFYTSSQVTGLLHHSSLTGGGSVLAAGEWNVEEGRLLTISGKTGHYKTPLSALHVAISHIESILGVPKNSYRVKLYEKQRNGAYVEVNLIAANFYQTYLKYQSFAEENYRVWGH